MLYASQRRPPRPGGDVLSLTAQPPGVIPGILTVYPGCTPRPRSLAEYRAACNAAEGDQVEEINAVNVMPGAVVWHGGHLDKENKLWVGGRWMTAIGTVRDGNTVEIDLVSDTGAGTRFAQYDTPVYVRRPGTHPMH